MSTDFTPPAQRHRQTSIDAAGTIPPRRVREQERWVYNALRATPMADWELWANRPPHLFDKLSSLHRARIGLLWRSRAAGASPYHPVEATDARRTSPESGKQCVVWQLKLFFRALSYEEWEHKYRKLAREP
jgi:hypothetical protein